MTAAPITSIAQFTIRKGCIPLALARVAAVREQADREQPGTLLYLVHRVLDEKHRPTRTLLFYECYRDQTALDAHLKSSSWKALAKGWGDCFEETMKDGIQLTSLERIAGFVHVALPTM